ncbi:MAG TPA: MFS transporter [Anseongella sp.]
MAKIRTTSGKFNETLLLLILSAINFAYILDFVIVMPLGPQLMRIFDIDATQFALVVSSYTISAGICGFIGIFFIDRFDRKKALLTSFGGFTVGTLLCALAPDYTFLLMARVFTGLFGGVISALIYSIVGDYIPYERRGRAMGKVMAAFAVASVMGVPIGIWLAAEFSWHMPFLALGLFSAVVFGVALMVLPPMKTHLREGESASNPMVGLKLILGDANQLRALVLMMLMMVAGFTVIPFISPYFVQNVGMTEMELVYNYLVGGACTFVSSQYIGKLADKYGKRQLLVVLCVLSIIPILLVTHLGGNVTSIGSGGKHPVLYSGFRKKCTRSGFDHFHGSSCAPG